MPLYPEEKIQKLLISSTSRFTGVCRHDSFLLAQAWSSLDGPDAIHRDVEGPLSRSAFVFSFEAEQPEPRPGVIVPDYSGVGELVASYLCLLFGKRFRSHGAIESSGSFRVPDFREYSEVCSPWLPQNSHSPRVDLDVPLKLEECDRLVPVLLGSVEDKKRLHAFRTACRFYMRALHATERDPEVAFLHLITVGELLAAQQSYEKNNLLDAEMLELLESIRAKHPDGVRLARQVQGRLLQLKRRFIRLVTDFVDAEFFSRREALSDYEALRPDTFEKTIAAAYDLRSRFVHVGVPFGKWIRSGGRRRLEEVQVGRPVVDDAELAKILHRAPTLLGLERVMRYCLFRFAEHSNLIARRAPESSREEAPSGG